MAMTLRFAKTGSCVRAYRIALCVASAVAAFVPVNAQPALAQDTPVRAAAASSALRPGDGLRVRIFREPELSGEFVVDERGIVVLPKIGEWAVNGIAAESLRPRLLEAYKKYLTTDAIEITPFRRIAVTGSVLKPGLYPIDPSMSIGDAVILAGGVAPNGKRSVVELRVSGAESGTRVASEQRVWDSGAGGVQQLYVPQQSWVRRNLLATVSAALSILTATVLLINTTR
ncbi:MAG: polysaccharide biosynthesis/export family protein [Gemmatimonas sp.]